MKTIYNPSRITNAALAFCVASGSMVIAEESKEAQIARAESAAPLSVSGDATILAVDGAVLREGSNGWTCLPGAAPPGVAPEDAYPICNDDVWTAFMKAVAEKADFKTDRVGISYMLQGDMRVSNEDPYDTEEDPGEVWVQDGPHLMIIVPDPAMLEGISNDPGTGGPYVMWKNTPYAHIMIPTAPREP